jgi:hypothetical protein
MKTIFYTITAFVLMGSSASIACNSSSALQADPSLEADVAHNPSAVCSLSLSQEGYDMGGVAGLAAAITSYYAQRGCRVDQGYLLQNLTPGTPICAVARYVRFQ